MELTREEVCKYAVFATDKDVSRFAKALLAEMDKPKVWDCAPNDAVLVDLYFYKHTEVNNQVGTKTYSRELPKSRARQIAEEVASEYDTHCDSFIEDQIADACEAAILKYAEENK